MYKQNQYSFQLCKVSEILPPMTSLEAKKEEEINKEKNLIWISDTRESKCIGPKLVQGEPSWGGAEGLRAVEGVSQENKTGGYDRLFHRFDYEKDLERHFTKLLILFFCMGRVGPEIWGQWSK